MGTVERWKGGRVWGSIVRSLWLKAESNFLARESPAMAEPTQKKARGSSMDRAHAADHQDLKDEKKAAEECNANIAHRLSPAGDLGKLQQQVTEKQIESNRLQDVKTDKQDLKDGKKAVEECNDVVADRLTPAGDLGKLQQQVTGKQIESNRLHDVKTSAAPARIASNVTEARSPPLKPVPKARFFGGWV